jgi:hypothetical protein
MFHTKAGMWVGIYFLGSIATAQTSFDSSQCDSSVIQYSWEQKYGGIHRTNSSGETLFKTATDLLLAGAESGDKLCSEAYLLVVEYILTSPNLDARKHGKYEDYLVEQIAARDNKENLLLWELIENAPTVSALWGDYEKYHENIGALQLEYDALATTIVTSYCAKDYKYSVHGGDYDNYMKACVSKWQ